MIQKLSLILLGLFLSTVVFPQAAEDILHNRNYLSGKGNGTTLEEADQHALNMLVNQISTTVESKFEIEQQENSDGSIKEQVHQIIKTYSSATLQNTERIIVSTEPDAVVIRYIKRSDADKIFQNRKLKIKEFCNFAGEALVNVNVSKAIMYYYWALTLLQSHPDKSSMRYTDDSGNSHLLLQWLPAKIKQIISDIRIVPEKTKHEDNCYTYYLNMTYQGEPIRKLTYSYWTGKDYTNLCDAKDGIGIAQFFGENAADREQIGFKIEYVFKNESNYDKELHTVMDRLSTVPVREAYINVPLTGESTQTGEEATEPKVNKKNTYDKISRVENIEHYETLLEPVINAVENKSYASVKDCFTEKGYEIFEKLIRYGNARPLAYKELRGLAKNGIVSIRSIPMVFSFKTNHKKFVEDVVFHFDENQKICDLNFSLSQTALGDILRKEEWAEKDRMVIVNFLEHYKTAYALERIDYIESIFSKDALIIVGNYKVKTNPENPYKNNRILTYNQCSKDEYIERLKLLFRSKEYVNIQFEKSQIRTGQKDQVYGIQIKQNYYSSNYGDEGYLFLMVDLQDSTKPLIHIRTWQPQPDQKNGIYGLEDF